MQVVQRGCQNHSNSHIGIGSILEEHGPQNHWLDEQDSFDKKDKTRSIFLPGMENASKAVATTISLAFHSFSHLLMGRACIAIVAARGNSRSKEDGSVGAGRRKTDPVWSRLGLGAFSGDANT